MKKASRFIEFQVPLAITLAGLMWPSGEIFSTPTLEYSYLLYPGGPGSLI